MYSGRRDEHESSAAQEEVSCFLPARDLRSTSTFHHAFHRLHWNVCRRIDYEQSVVFLRDSRVGEHAWEVIFARVRVLSHPTVPEKNEGLLVV